jgi:hypothetical protein
MFWANTPEDQRRFIEMGVRGILTDHPDVLRATIRSLDLGPLEFELQRAAVHTAITRTIQQQRMLEMGRSTGPAAARNLNEALDALLRSQNSLLRIWLEYEIERMRLDFDLGVMPLDENGMWPLDAQGMWIHSQYLEGETPPPSEAPDPFLPDVEMEPVPELPEPPELQPDLVQPAAAFVPWEGDSNLAVETVRSVPALGAASRELEQAVGAQAGPGRDPSTVDSSYSFASPPTIQGASRDLQQALCVAPEPGRKTPEADSSGSFPSPVTIEGASRELDQQLRAGTQRLGRQSQPRVGDADRARRRPAPRRPR